MPPEEASSPAAEDTSAPGLATEAPAATEHDDDIDTDHLDRVEAEDENEAAKKSRIAAEGGEGAEGEGAEGAAKRRDVGDDGLVDVELNGKTYKLPPELKDGVLAHADYTRKAQEVAQRARALDAERQTWDQQREESRAALPEEHAKIALVGRDIQLANATLDEPLDNRGTTLRTVDWPGYRAQLQGLPDDDPNVLQYQQLRRAHDGALQSVSDGQRALEAAKEALTTKEQARLDEQAKGRETTLATARQETGKVLTSEGWDQQRFADTASFAATELGYSPEELMDAVDPRAWRMADMLRSLKAENVKLKTAQTQTAKALSNVKDQASRPAEPAKGNAQPTRPRDDNSTESWMERRNRQVAAKQAKARAAR